MKAYQSTENLRYKLAPLFGKIEVTSVIAILRPLQIGSLERKQPSEPAYVPSPGAISCDARTRSWKSAPRAQEVQMRPSFPHCLFVYDSSRLVGMGDLQNEPGEAVLLSVPSVDSGCDRHFGKVFREACQERR